VLLLCIGSEAQAQRVLGTWTPQATMGTGRFWAFSTAANGKVYGGTGRLEFSSLTPLNDFWAYDPATDGWTQQANYPGNREGATAFTIGNRIFAGFGTAFIQFQRDLYEFLPDSNRWEPRASAPGIGFAYSHGFVIDSVYYIGPENGTNHVYAYHANTDTWQQVADFPGGDRRAQVSFAVQGKGYIGMGAGVFSGVFGDFFAYDPLTDTWAEVASISPRSDQSTAFAVGDYGYVMNAGGSGGGGKDTYRYDPAADLWEYEATLPGDRIANATACALDSLGFFLFGERTVSGGNFASDQVFVFRPGHDSSLVDTTTAIVGPAIDSPRWDLRVANDQLTLDWLADPHQPARLSLFDITGRFWQSTTWSSGESLSWSLASIPPGMYLIQLQLPGAAVQTRKWLRR
jgi:N-acetylneuraminic acid mutarotase